MATVPTISEHIEITPGTCGGKPRIAGHRISVQNIVISHERMGLSPDEIVGAYPSITLADVYAALAYYHDHRDEIREDIERGERLADEIEATQPSILERIKAERPEAYQSAVERLRAERWDDLP